MPTVELIYDRDCPNVAQARAQLLRAFAESKVEPRWQEWRGDDADSPSRVRGNGSPTIRSVPAVVIDGKLADCCAGRGPDEATLRQAGLGQPRP